MCLLVHRHGASPRSPTRNLHLPQLQVLTPANRHSLSCRSQQLAPLSLASYIALSPTQSSAMLVPFSFALVSRI